MRFSSEIRGLAVLLPLCVATPVSAQDRADVPYVRSITTIGSVAERQLRDLQVAGSESGHGFLVRSPSSMISGEEGGLRLWLLPPRVDLTWNSDIPFSLNDEGMWAGRGLSSAVQAGFRGSWGPLSLVVAPELLHAQNLDTRVPSTDVPGRSAFSSPWHTGEDDSADLPLRFGNQSLLIVGPGQSSISLSARGLTLGAGTENQWWGPGVRNALVMSNHAQGIPHLFVRTEHPWATRLGHVDVKWMVGSLTESIYFDTIAANDNRSISALAATLHPAFEPDLAIGVARSVVRSVSSPEGAVAHATDVLVRWDSRSATAEDGTVMPPSSDQILSAFARWIFPRERAEVYAEWARVELPKSVRDFLTLPNHTQGYTLGMQWLSADPLDSAIRLQLEFSSIEKGAAARQRPSPSYYVGRATPQGYTHRGQLIGAAIGPGGSSQWLAVEYVRPEASAGLFAGRIRWENDAFYNRPVVSRFDHDVTVFGGVRANARFPWSDIEGRLTLARRYNYLFQFKQSDPVKPRPAQDLNNLTLELSVVPFPDR